MVENKTTVKIGGETFSILFPDLLRPLTDEEFSGLKRSIEKNGILVPVVVDSDYGVIDGGHRLMIAEDLGLLISEIPVTRYHHLNYAGKLDLAKTLNIQRRHLDAEGKRAAIAYSLRKNPEQSNRRIASDVGAHHETVGSIRGELESTGEIRQLKKTVGADRKERSARRPVKVAIAAEPEEDAEKAPTASWEETFALARQALEAWLDYDANGDHDGRLELARELATCAIHQIKALSEYLSS